MWIRTDHLGFKPNANHDFCLKFATENLWFRILIPTNPCSIILLATKLLIKKHGSSSVTTTHNRRLPFRITLNFPDSFSPNRIGQFLGHLGCNRLTKLKKFMYNIVKQERNELLLSPHKKTRGPRAGPPRAFKPRPETSPGFSGPGRKKPGPARESPARESPARPAGFLDFFLFFKRISN